MCVLIGLCAGHSNYSSLPVIDRLSMCHVVSAIIDAYFSSLAIVKFKLVSVTKILHWVTIKIMFPLWNIISCSRSRN